MAYTSLSNSSDFVFRGDSSDFSWKNYPKKVKWSRYRPDVAQRVGRGIALLFHDRGTRRGWVVSSTPRPHFTPGKDPVPILQEAGWAPGPVWTGGKSCPHRDSIPDRPARSQSLYRLSYPAHLYSIVEGRIFIEELILGIFALLGCYSSYSSLLRTFRDNVSSHLERPSPRI